MRSTLLIPILLVLLAEVNAIFAGQAKRDETRFAEASRNGRLANEAFSRCRRYVDGWLTYCDPQTGLFPRNLGFTNFWKQYDSASVAYLRMMGVDRQSNFWNGRDSAADNYPFMVLTAAMTDRDLMNGRLLAILRTEEQLTSRVGCLPDDYSFVTHSWRNEKINLGEIIFNGAEYVKDGLLPVTEWLGHSPWSERMLRIMDDIWANAVVETPHGKIPTPNIEVNGDLLQACSRLYWFTGDRKFLDWGIRLGDYYLLGTNHPTRNLKELRLKDHGCEVINGLTELYVACAHAAPPKRRAYQKPLQAIFDDILKFGRNRDGLLYDTFSARTGEHSTGLCDTWGYDYDGFYTMWLLDKKRTYRAAVRQALASLKGKYVGACWSDKTADGFADSIEGALNLFNREPVTSAADWIDSQTRLMWDRQQPDGIIEGWHGDGNFARTSLMYALWKTQGLTVEPWRADVRFGAVRDGRRVFISMAANDSWQGRMIFDRPRHKEVMRLPLDYPRINQFPEWFVVRSDASCWVKTDNDAESVKYSGKELCEGLSVALTAGQEKRFIVELR